MSDYSDNGPGKQAAERIGHLVTAYPWTVVVIFLLLTGVFTVGVSAAIGEDEAGEGQFTEGTEAQEAFDEIQEKFEPRERESGGATAQLVVDTDRNVLSKRNLLRMLEFQHRVETDADLRVESTTSPASLAASQLDPSAETPEEMYRAVERAPQRRIDAAIAQADEADGIPVSTDFTRPSASASVAQIAITYDLPPDADDADALSVQSDTEAVANAIDGWDSDENILLFSSAIVDQENSQLLGDSAAVVFPAAVVLILVFLVIAYRDPVDLGLGLVALGMTFVWTYGFMGFANIPFSESIITVFALVLAVGIDFGIHTINRYREERTKGAGITGAMGISTRQLLVAFLIVTLTTSFSFLSNIISGQTQNFGVVSAAGVVFTFLIFGVFLPAGKVGLDQLREGSRFPEFGSTPLGSEGSLLSRGLSVGVTISRIAPALLLLTLVILGGGAAVYGTGVEAEFDTEVFFPEQERIEQYQSLPGPLGIGEYTFVEYTEYLEEDFETGREDTVTIYVEDRELRSGGGLATIDRALKNPPDSFQREERRADADTILDVIESQAESDPGFANTVERYDTTGDGIPNREVDAVYEELFASEAGDRAATRLTRDGTATRIDIRLSVDADQDEAVRDAKELAAEMPLDATATGQLVIFEEVAQETTDAAVTNLLAAVLLTTTVLILSFWVFEGRLAYGFLTLVPILGAVVLLVASMRYFDIALSPITAPILSVSIGLGVDYTVHFMHRFTDEFSRVGDVYEALSITVRGTGGALTGSMITTTSGLGVLYVALIPVLVEFGLLIALGVFYSWLSSLVVLPSMIVVWNRVRSRKSPEPDSGSGVLTSSR